MTRRHLMLWLLIAALAVPLSGAIPIQASSRHWALTAWALDTIKRRSVATYSIRVAAPPLDDARLQVKGAALYERNCLPCHGSPETSPPPIPHGMTPHPPDLRAHVPRWKPRELFYIVKHGIKFTGMPAWPALERDDEIWAVVAFLRRLPDLGAAAYGEMARGDGDDDVPVSTAGPAGASPEYRRCAPCHGADGLGRRGAFPRLAGQHREYLMLALEAYRKGRRHSGVMTPVAADLSATTMRDVVGYYAGLPPADASGRHEPPSRGAAIAHEGVAAQDVPACRECHGPGPARNPAYPALAGQPAEYLVQQLELLAEGRRGGSAFEHVMRPIASRLTAAQRVDVATFYASFGDGRRTVTAPAGGQRSGQ